MSLLAGKFGGPKAVLQALKEYPNLAEIRNRVSKAKSELSALESEITKVNTKHSHLATAINMCETLINQYKFGLDAVATVLSVAEKYGSALDVLKALEGHKKLEALDQERAKREGEVSQLKEEIAQLEGQRKQT